MTSTNDTAKSTIISNDPNQNQLSWSFNKVKDTSSKECKLCKTGLSWFGKKRYNCANCGGAVCELCI